MEDQEEGAPDSSPGRPGDLHRGAEGSIPGGEEVSGRQ